MQDEVMSDLRYARYLRHHGFVTCEQWNIKIINSVINMQANEQRLWASSVGSTANEPSTLFLEVLLFVTALKLFPYAY